MRHGSLFSGGGGFDLAAESMGWTNVFNCEIDPYAQRILRKNFPDSIQYEDIKQTDFYVWKYKIDILTGSDPCQPSSFMGKRTGMCDDRYLWPEMFRAIKEIKPKWVVNENVTGTISNGILDEKIRQLEDSFYTCWPPFIIPSLSVGTYHKRERVWLVAHTERMLQPREESCSRKAGRMEWDFEPISTNGNWEEEISRFRGMANGIPHVLDRTDIIRNAIVPQMAYNIFKAIEQYETTNALPRG